MKFAFSCLCLTLNQLLPPIPSMLVRPSKALHQSWLCYHGTKLANPQTHLHLSVSFHREVVFRGLPASWPCSVTYLMCCSWWWDSRSRARCASRGVLCISFSQGAEPHLPCFLSAQLVEITIVDVLPGGQLHEKPGVPVAGSSVVCGCQDLQ